MNPETIDYRTVQSREGSLPTPALRALPVATQAHRRSVGSWVLWAIVAAVLLAGIYLVVVRIKQTQSGATSTARGFGRGGAPPVVAAQTGIGDVPIYRIEPGTVVPFNTVVVHTRVDGQLIKVSFEEGQIVKAGDVLAQIDPSPFQAQLIQAQGQLARDQAQQKNASLDLKRYEDAPGNTFTQQQIDTQSATVDQFGGIVKSDQGNVDSAQVNLNYCTITAPAQGRIGLRNVDQGNIVHANDANGLAVITQLQPISVVFSIVQDDINQVMNNSTSVPPLEVTALDQDVQNVLARGTLTAIDSQVSNGTNRLRLKARFENQNNALFPNQFVNARLLLATRKNMVIVPSTAIQHGPDNLIFVYVVGADKKVEVRNVTLGPDDNESASIESGLAAGEIVVTDGVDKLQPNMTVVMRLVDASSPGGSTRPSSATRGSGRRGRRGGAGGAGGNAPGDGQGGSGGAGNAQ